MKTYTYIQKTILLVIFLSLFLGLPLKAEKLEFSLMDSFGREVSSQDYKGVPIFLEFGACW